MGSKLLTISIVFVLVLTAVVIADGRETKDEMLMDALVYTYPMVLVEKTIETQSNTVDPDYDLGKAPINQFIHTQKLADADFKAFTMPNVDTIYSVLNYDISNEPYILVIPDTDRFFNVQILNAWIDVIAVFGDAGKDVNKIVLCNRDCREEFPDDVVVVRSDTDRGVLGARTFIDGKDDLQNVIDIQNKMLFQSWAEYKNGIPFTPSEGTFDEDSEFVPHNKVAGMGLQEYFDFANERMLSNHPYEADLVMLRKLAKINVGPGLEFDATIFGEDFEKKWQETMVNLYSHTLAASKQFTVTDGVWSYHGYPIADFGTEYEYRAFVAYTGYVANPVSVALYITTKMDSYGNAISSSKTYNIHFEENEFPPYLGRGFWSLTVYGADFFLIDNEIDRYSVNNRMVFVTNPDNSVDIILSETKPDDISNWLPISGEGILLTIRIYVPNMTAIDSDWKCPTIYPVE